MSDLKLVMEAQQPTPQRLAASLSIRQLAPKKFAAAVKKKDFVSFAEGIQISWRIWLAVLKRGHYEVLDSKKFGYARNCPPVLVSSSVPDVVGCRVRLVPCRLLACPFCYGRMVMKVQDTVTSALISDVRNSAQIASDSPDGTFKVSVRFGFFDVEGSSWDACYTQLEELWDAVAYEGTISKRIFWLEGGSVRGRLSFAGMNPRWPLLGEFKEKVCGLNEWSSSEFCGNRPLANTIAKRIGSAFVYPPASLYVDADQHQALGVFFNDIQNKKRRLYRTTGRLRGVSTEALSTRKANITTWRENFNEQLGTILTELSDIKEVLQQFKGNNDG